MNFVCDLCDIDGLNHPYCNACDITSTKSGAFDNNGNQVDIGDNVIAINGNKPTKIGKLVKINLNTRLPFTVEFEHNESNNFNSIIKIDLK